MKRMTGGLRCIRSHISLELRKRNADRLDGTGRNTRSCGIVDDNVAYEEINPPPGGHIDNAGPWKQITKENEPEGDVQGLCSAPGWVLSLQECDERSCLGRLAVTL